MTLSVYVKSGIPMQKMHLGHLGSGRRTNWLHHTGCIFKFFGISEDIPQGSVIVEYRHDVVTPPPGFRVSPTCGC